MYPGPCLIAAACTVLHGWNKVVEKQFLTKLHVSHLGVARHLATHRHHATTLHLALLPQLTRPLSGQTATYTA